MPETTNSSLRVAESSSVLGIGVGVDFYGCVVRGFAIKGVGLAQCVQWG